jgi:hypothetical protein
VDDQGYGVALERHHLAQVEDDVEVALGVDQVPQDGVDPGPVGVVNLPMDGDDHRPARAADAEARRGPHGSAGVIAAGCRDVPFLMPPGG